MVQCARGCVDLKEVGREEPNNNKNGVERHHGHLSRLQLVAEAHRLQTFPGCTTRTCGHIVSQDGLTCTVGPTPGDPQPEPKA